MTDTLIVGLALIVVGLSALAVNPVVKWWRRSDPDRLVVGVLGPRVPAPRTRAVSSGRKSGRTAVQR